MITFKTSPYDGYTHRTRENASADATIAIALDFTTGGEKLTKKCVKEQGKMYIPIDFKNTTISVKRVNEIVRRLELVKAKTLNIAGNGIYTMRHHNMGQEQVDWFTHELLLQVFKQYKGIELIRSGGQTGFDEAGIKAAVKLGIPALVYGPKDWRYRDLMGYDTKDEKRFKERFGIVEN